MVHKEKIFEIIDTARVLKEAKSNSDFLYRELSKLDENRLNNIRNVQIRKPGPVNRLRSNIATLLLNKEIVNDDVVENQKTIIEKDEIKDVFKAWKNPFSIFYPFFINTSQHTEKELLKSISEEIQGGLGLEGLVSLKTVDYNGAQNFGSDVLWMAMYNKIHESQKTAKQLFVRIGADGIFCSFYDRPLDEHVESINIDPVDFDIFQIIEFFQKYKKEILNDDSYVRSEIREFTNNPKVYKLSHGTVLSEIEVNQFLAKNIVVIHRGTGKKGKSSNSQFDIFCNALNGDIFYLCRANTSLILVGRFITNYETCEIQYLGDDGWVQRKYEILYRSIKKGGYKGKLNKWWLPNHNSTFSEILPKEFKTADREIFVPFFNNNIEDIREFTITPMLDKTDDKVKVGNLSHNYTNPQNHDVEDQLNVLSDIKAFASLLAYKKATPPIAIGLFGNWGSGKSYFMSNIKKEIERLNTVDNDYCDRIVHVEFNSWYYTDANLWASLVSKIFNDLNKFLNKNQDEDSVKSFYSELSSVKSDLNNISSKLSQLKEDKAILEEDLKKAIRKRKEDALKLENIKVKEAAIAVLESPLVNEILSKIKADLNESVGKSKDDFLGYCEEINSSEKRFVKSIRLLYKKGWRFWLSILLVIGTGIGISYSYGYFNSDIKNVVLMLIEFIGGMGPIIIFIRPILKKVNRAYRTIFNVANKWDELVKIEEQKICEEELKLTESLEILEQQELRIQAEITSKESNRLLIEEEINDIKTGKKLAQFINDRSDDSNYKKKLGVVSWVREDFEELDRLIRRQEEVESLEKDESEDSIDFKIDRIILYIDDLDRCPEERVVEVLEAVHLLLSFELFGVVVGVDPRWLSHSLNHKYEGLLKETLEIDLTTNIQATTYDYLEKIFQIPFALLPIEKKAAQNLIESMMFTDKNDNNSIVDTLPDPVIPEPNPGPDPEIDPSDFIRLGSNNDPIASKNLNVSEEEINFALNFAEIIGDSPRTIQRFVNVYRIIRAHPKVQLSEEFSEDHRCIIFLLAIVIGEPYIANNMVRLILENNSKSITLTSVLKKIGYYDELLKAIGITILSQLNSTKCIGYKKWTPLVSRFSFRSAEMMSNS